MTAMVGTPPEPGAAAYGTHPFGERVVLASQSRTRARIFARLGIDFEAVPSGIDERTPDRPAAPERLVRFLARRKAEHVARAMPDRLVLGFDTIGVLDGVILEKPDTLDEARARLTGYAGREVGYLTGCCVIAGARGVCIDEIAETRIRFSAFGPSDVERYMAAESSSLGAALGLDPASVWGSALIASIEGSVCNFLYTAPVDRFASWAAQIAAPTVSAAGAHS